MMNTIHSVRASKILAALLLLAFNAACATKLTSQPDNAPEESVPSPITVQRIELPPQPEPIVVSPSVSTPVDAEVLVQPNIEITALSQIPSVSSHFWSRLDHYKSEPEGYASYTYVLTGRTGTGSRHERRFHVLVDAITTSTSNDAPSDLIVPVSDKSESNVFIIPSSTALAKRYVTTLQTAVSRESQRFSEPGPFLVVLGSPLESDQRGIKNMLLVDLTNTHEGAFKQIVKTLKNRLISDNVSEVEILRSIKSFLLSTLFIAEDSLVFAKVAQAEFRELFSTE